MLFTLPCHLNIHRQVMNHHFIRSCKTMPHTTYRGSRNFVSSHPQDSGYKEIQYLPSNIQYTGYLKILCHSKHLGHPEIQYHTTTYRVFRNTVPCNPQHKSYREVLYNFRGMIHFKLFGIQKYTNKVSKELIRVFKSSLAAQRLKIPAP